MSYKKNRNNTFAFVFHPENACNERFCLCSAAKRSVKKEGNLRCRSYYNNHFNCYLPSIINRPQHYPIIPIKKSPARKYIPNKLIRKSAKKKKKSHKKINNVLNKNEITDHAVEPVPSESEPKLSSENDPEPTTTSKHSRSTKKPRKSKTRSSKHRKISVPSSLHGFQPPQDIKERTGICSGSKCTQTSRKSLPNLRELLKAVSDAKRIAADYGIKRPEIYKSGEQCRCAEPYIQREQAYSEELVGFGCNYGEYGDEFLECLHWPKLREEENFCRQPACIPETSLYLRDCEYRY